jgi:hypothetical protein
VLGVFPSGNGKLHFAHPSTQQQLLVWRDRPKAVLVIKKLGDELLQEFNSVSAQATFYSVSAYCVRLCEKHNAEQYCHFLVAEMTAGMKQRCRHI